MASARRWDTELQAAINAARHAGDVLLDWAGKISVTRKQDGDLVTEADLAAQRSIEQSLHRQFPGDEILAEEGEQRHSEQSPRRWIVDPLDGTNNYIHRFPFFCTSIGFESTGQLVVGVVYDPVRKECFSASKGAGAACNGAALKASDTADLGGALLAANLPPLSNRPHCDLQAFTRLAHKCRSMRWLGSSALALAYVAAGRLDGFWGIDVRPWDAAAGVLLSTEAGGSVSNADLSPYNLYTHDILATNGLIHAAIAAEIAPTDHRLVQ